MRLPKIAQQRFLEILDDVDTGVYFLDKQRRITHWSRGAERIAGYTADEVVGTSCADDILIHVDDHGVNLCREGCPVTRTIESGEPVEANVYLHHRAGHRVPVRVRTSPLRRPSGTIAGAVETFTDLSAVRSAEARVSELERLVMLDEVTRVGNRRYGEGVVAGRLAELERYGSPFGVLFVDVDGFKAVNDGRGHAVGDEILRLVTATLVSNVRPFDEVARWGGDEFLVACPNAHLTVLEGLSERLRMLIERSAIMRDDWVVTATVSVGATLARKGDTVESVVGRADEAMYAAKTAGRNRVRVR